jgi:glycosyltransferase involved in cell wall biosynthesis
MPDVSVAYYLAGYHPELPDEYIDYWSKQPVQLIGRLLKRPLTRVALSILAREGKPLSLRFDNVACVSDYVRQRLISQGLISANAVVIHNGVDLSEFSPSNNLPMFVEDGLRCIIAGHVKPGKGVHTIVEALACMRSDGDSSKVSLMILGSGPSDYIARLQDTVSANHLEDRVEFHPAVPREQVPEILTQYNTLVLATTYDEPLARAMQEGMAMGLLVIGTTTGGSGELLVHEKTGLVFEADNPESLAEQFRRALGDPAMATRLSKAGQQEVMEHFNIEYTIEQVESFLESLVQTRRGH